MAVGTIFTTQQLATTLGITVQSVNRIAVREKWQSLGRSGYGGANTWLVSSMPKSTRELIMAGMLRQGQNSGEICEKVGTDFGANALNGAILQENGLKNGQNDTKSAYQKATANERATANARLLFIQEVARLSAIGGREKAIQHICTGSALGTLAEPLASNAATALMARGKTEISRRTLYRWIKGYETHAIDGLLPRRESGQ